MWGPHHIHTHVNQKGLCQEQHMDLFGSDQNCTLWGMTEQHFRTYQKAPHKSEHINELRCAITQGSSTFVEPNPLPTHTHFDAVELVVHYEMVWFP